MQRLILIAAALALGYYAINEYGPRGSGSGFGRGSAGSSGISGVSGGPAIGIGAAAIGAAN